jgi:hypothetical protein
MNIRKNTLVNYMLVKTFLSAFSWLSSLFIITFSLIAYLMDIFSYWLAGRIISLLYLNNFINIFFNGKETLVIIVGICFGAVGALGITILYRCFRI